ncbi:MAG: Maf family protein [Boseongicola sp.]|nr:Maf family protein [Boseongicola sp.]
MPERLILASGSAARAEILRRAGVAFCVIPAQVDEEAVKAGLLAEGARFRDIADALAEAKVRKVAAKHPEALVLGADQVLEFGGKILSKPDSRTDAVRQLMSMRGLEHKLHSAAVIYEGLRPAWRHVGQARLNMAMRSEDWIKSYVDRNWDHVRRSVGAYRIEDEGVRLFSRIDGDHFVVLGLPLLEVLSYLTMRGTLPS